MLESPDYFFRVREIGRLRQTKMNAKLGVIPQCACAEIGHTSRVAAVSLQRWLACAAAASLVTFWARLKLGLHDSTCSPQEYVTGDYSLAVCGRDKHFLVELSRDHADEEP